MSETTQVSQETNLSATPAPVTPATSASTPEAKPETTQSTQTASDGVPENWVYNGDRTSVPKQFENYVKGFDRYWTQKSQALSEYEKKAREYDQLVSSDAYKTFQQSFANEKSLSTNAAPAQPMASQDELDAIMAGDGKTLSSVIERAVEAKLAVKEQEYNAKLEPIATNQKRLETAEMIKSFADIHPDFWELYDSGYENYLLSAVREGKGLDGAYQEIKQIEAKTEARLEAKRKKMIEEKKNGTVVSSTVTGTPDVVYAENEDQAKRLAIQLTLKGDPRTVAIRSRK